MGETKADIAALAGCFGRVICIEIDLELKATILECNKFVDVVDAAVEEFKYMIIDGQTVAAICSTTGAPNALGDSAVHDLVL